MSVGLPSNVNWVRLTIGYCNSFWLKFGGKRNNGVGFDEDEKIAELVRLSEINTSDPSRPGLPLRRSFFNERKRRIHSLKKYGTCFVCGVPASCRHHIVQLQNGGVNHRSNVASVR